MGRNDLKRLLDEKKMVKEKVFLKFWPQASARNPMVMIFASENKDIEKILFQILEGLLVLPVHVMIVSDNQPEDFPFPHQGKFVWLNSKTSSKTQMDNWLLASDMALLFDEHQDTVKKLFDKGVIPVGLDKSPLLANYNPNEETGNSFTFRAINPWDVFSAFVRANETYRFPYDWQHIIRGALEVR